jgi:Tetratricopeptide repeat
MQAVRDLAQDTSDRSRQVLGEDYPDTLYAANILASALRRLGDVRAACDLDRDIMVRRRRVLGEDHPGT